MSNSSSFVAFNTMSVNTIANKVDFPLGMTIAGATQPSLTTSAPTVSVTAGSNVTSANVTVKLAMLTVIGNYATLRANIAVVPTAINTGTSFTISLPQRTTSFTGDQDIICSVRNGFSGNLSPTNVATIQVATATVASSTTVSVSFNSNSVLSDPHKFSVEYNYTIN